MKLMCDIYRCSSKEGMYIYLEKDAEKEQLPEALLKQTGRLELAMSLLLTPEKQLARAKADDVIKAIHNQGFYVQMPPILGAEAEANHRAINEANHFLER